MGTPGERVWFRDAVEGLFARDLKSVLTPAHHAELKSLGIDPLNLVPAYPLASFRAAIKLVGPLVAPNQPPFEQQVELGHRLMRGYFDTFAGRVVKKVMSIVGPDRGITRIARHFRTLNNYLDARLLEKQVGFARASFAPVEGLTGLFLGINQGAGVLLSSGKLHTNVALESDDGEEAVLRFEWGPPEARRAPPQS